MNLKLLMDGVVRQTTVLLAQLSTTAGARSPLAHVADQVFVELAREIESQGVRRQVVADMFGMALRSYQKKMRRLTEKPFKPARLPRSPPIGRWAMSSARPASTPRRASSSDE